MRFNRLGLSILAATLWLTGCGVSGLGPLAGSQAPGSFGADARKAIGGDAYSGFRLAPTLPTANGQRGAVKLTYLMTDDTAHQSPQSLGMLKMMDDLAEKNVYNVVFRDGGELGDSRLYYMQQGDHDADKVANPESLLAPGVSEVQSNNPRVFSQILGWTLDNYPGRRKYLQIYTHGAGVFGIGCDEKQTDLKGNLVGDDKQIWAMPITDFAEALRQALKGRQLDLLYFRACLMGNVEALYELRGTTRYALASEDVSYSVTNSNLTMTKMFDDLAESDAAPEAIAKQMAIQAGAKHPQGKDGDKEMQGYTTFAAVDLAQMDELKSAINTLSRALIAAMPSQKAQILAAYDAVPTVQGGANPVQYYEQMRDLWAFTAQLQQRVTDKGVLDAVAQVRSAQSAAMIHEKDSFGSASNGLSIFMPSRAALKDQMGKYLTGRYQQTRFAQDTVWDDFLKVISAGGGN